MCSRHPSDAGSGLYFSFHSRSSSSFASFDIGASKNRGPLVQEWMMCFTAQRLYLASAAFERRNSVRPLGSVKTEETGPEMPDSARGPDAAKSLGDWLEGWESFPKQTPGRVFPRSLTRRTTAGSSGPSRLTPPGRTYPCSAPTSADDAALIAPGNGSQAERLAPAAACVRNLRGANLASARGPARPAADANPSSE